MAHEILSAKLCELDQKIGRLHSRIQLSETGSRTEIQTELAIMRRECQEDRCSLQERMRHSRFQPSAHIAGAFDEIGTILDRLREEIRQSPGGMTAGDRLPEEKILLAEYMLDFAMQAANQALFVSLEAIEAQNTQQEQEAKKP